MNQGKKNQKKIPALIVVLLTMISIIIALQGFIFQAYASENVVFTGLAETMTIEQKHTETLRSSYSDRLPQLTILTHGQGGDASHWSNDIIAENGKFSCVHGGTPTFVYDSNSIIEKLRRSSGGGNVFLAKINGPDGSGKKSFTLSRCLIPDNAHDLDLYKSEPVQYLEISDIQSHNIIVFDSTNSAKADSHEVIYSELDMMIDTILMDYVKLTNSIPTINLIGHSRGGLTNIMYASRHPFNIDSVFSMGTPYHGSNLSSVASLAKMDSSTNNNSARDILNPVMMDKIKNEWNDAFTLNPKMNVFALGSAASFEYIAEIINQNYLHEYVEYQDMLEMASTLINLFNQYPDILKLAYNLENIVYKFVDYFNFQFLPDGLTFRDIQNLVEEITEAPRNFDKFMDMEVDKIVDTEKQFVFCDDIFIDLHSQLAHEFNGINRAVKIFTSDNANMDAVTMTAPPAIHNLEPRDKDLHDYILSKIRLSDNDCKFNTELNGDGSVNISSINWGHFKSNSVEIPSSIDGKPVAKIGSNIFRNNYYGFDTTRITSVNLPVTLQDIGANAFYGSGIKSITIPENVKSIEPGAFANCQNLIAINVEEDNLYYQSIDGVLYSKDGQTLVQYPAGKTATDLILNYNTKNIGDKAFEGQKNINSITLSNIQSIGNDAFLNAQNLIDVYNDEHILNVGRNAFDGTQWIDDSNDNVILGKVFIKYNSSTSTVTIPEYIEQIAGGAFESTITTSVILPNNLKSIGSYAFYNCDKLTKILIPKNVEEIGDYAFANSMGISEVVMLTLYPPKLGYGVFNNEASNRKIFVPGIQREAYEQKLDWKAYSNAFDVKSITINFDSNGATPYEDTITVDYYSYINNLPIVKKPNYIFRGWFLNGNLYTDDSILDVYADTVTFKAKWDVVTYRINYIVRNGSNNPLNITQYNCETKVVLHDPVPKAGYAFAGWYLNSRYTGEKITGFPIGSSGTKVVYAKIIPIKYTVSLDVNDTEEHPAFVEPDILTDVEYDSANLMPIPNREGYSFTGWYDQPVGGTQYTNGKGEAIIPWDKVSDVTLYAHWAVEQYYIKVDMNGSIVWLGADGKFSEIEIPLTYGQTFVCPHALALELINAPSMKMGYKFKYFLAPNGEPLHIVYYTVPDYGANGAVYAITAEWEKEKHSIYFNSDGGTNVNNMVDVLYDDSIDLPIPKKTGYTFKGWQVETSIEGYPKQTAFRFYRMPDLTTLTQQNGSIGLIALWENAIYTIYFDSVGGSLVGSKEVRYNELPSTYDIPEKRGYEFLGWYDSRDYTNIFADMNGNPVKKWELPYGADLYAKWSPISYTIEYDLDGGVNNTLNIRTYTVEETVSLYPPTKDGYEFEGWFDIDNGTYCTHISINSIGKRNFQARWYADVSLIGNSGGTYAYTARTVIVDLSNANKETAYVFDINMTVNEITFTSNHFSNISLNMSIICQFRNTDITIRFNNINMAPTTKDINGITVNGNNIGVYFYYTGTNKITGGEGTSRFGVNETGNVGAAGIFAKENYVYISGTGAMSIIGGQGGMSGKGMAGARGTNGNNAGLFIANGGNATDGSAGLTGMNGAMGGFGIDAGFVGLKDIVKNLSIKGGQGGSGGTGGRGGDGGNGGRGGGSVLICCNGGNGGNGGKGGRGGNGGIGGFAINGTHSIESSILSSGRQGIKGRGGDGGNGGYGGANGPSSLASGEHGNGGIGGDGGDSGSGVIDGHSESYYIGTRGNDGGYHVAEWQ